MSNQMPSTMQQYWVAKDGEVTLFDLEDGEDVEEHVSEMYGNDCEWGELTSLKDVRVGGKDRYVECDACQGKCRSNEILQCKECYRTCRIGCWYNPSDESFINGLCDDCHDEESDKDGPKIVEKDECGDCEGKCRADETETCEKCAVKLRIGCGNNPSDESIFNGLCDDCRDEESDEDEPKIVEKDDEDPMICGNVVGGEAIIGCGGTCYRSDQPSSWQYGWWSFCKKCYEDKESEDKESENKDEPKHSRRWFENLGYFESEDEGAASWKSGIEDPEVTDVPMNVKLRIGYEPKIVEKDDEESDDDKE